MKSLKEIREGFFDNVTPEISTKPLQDFINEHTVIKAKGKEYLVVGQNIYNLQEFKSRYISLMSGKGIEEERGVKNVREIDFRDNRRPFQYHIQQVSMTLRFIHDKTKENEVSTFYYAPIWGLGEKAMIGYHGASNNVIEAKIKELF